MATIWFKRKISKI